jgi:hypothetical protein
VPSTLNWTHTCYDISLSLVQRYFINSSVYKPGGPVFLCVGGEGPPLTEDVVETGGLHCALMVHLAVQNSALILALEHRYYGMSQPFPDLSTPNLRFLSSRQALQDIALFHEHITSLVSLPQATKWVTFGGSYPGMLAAWARSKFPHLFHASVSSSSPVEAILNMQGYNDVTVGEDHPSCPQFDLKSRGICSQLPLPDQWEFRVTCFCFVCAFTGLVACGRHGGRERAMPQRCQGWIC